MKQFTKRETSYLLRYEDRHTIAQLAEHFKCTPKEVYAYYDKLTQTKEYRDFVFSRTNYIQKEKRFGYDKVGSTNESGENGEETLTRLPNVYYNASTGTCVAYNLWGDIPKTRCEQDSNSICGTTSNNSC